MLVVDCVQGSPEWVAIRAAIATASRFGDVLATVKSGEAAARRNYRAQLVVQRLTGKYITTGFVSAQMKQGTEREPLARDAYMVKTGYYVQQVGFIKHESIEAGGSPDGLVEDDGGLEIKCPEIGAHLEYLKLTREPSIYTPQIQGYMWITGRKWWDFASYNPDFPPNLQLVIRRVQRDEKYIAGLALAVKLFMDEVMAEEAEMRKLQLQQAA